MQYTHSFDIQTNILHVQLYLVDKLPALIRNDTITSTMTTVGSVHSLCHTGCCLVWQCKCFNPLAEVAGRHKQVLISLIRLLQRTNQIHAHQVPNFRFHWYWMELIA